MREVQVARRLIALTALLPLCGHLPGMADLGAQEKVRLVLSARGSNDDRTPDVVAEELAVIGAGAIPVLIGLVDGTALPLLMGATQEGEAIDVSDWWRGPDAFGPVAFEALGRLPARDVLPYLAEHTDETTPLEGRLLAVRIVGRIGSADGIELLCELSSYCSDYELRYRSVCEPLERAFERVLSGERQSVERLRRRLDGLQHEVQAVVIDAVVASGSAKGFRILETLIEGDHGPDQRVLGAVAELGDRRRWRLDDEPARLLRLYLSHADPAVRRSAAAGLERLQDASSCRLLITLLQDESAAVRRTGLWALRRLSGVPLDGEAGPWQAWLDEQEGWWRRESDRLAARLDSGEEAQVLDAIRRFSERPFYRHEIALLLAGALDHERSDVRLVACDALRRLRSSAAVPALAAQLYGSDEEVRQSAWRALCELTGEDLPLDARAWSSYVDD